MTQRTAIPLVMLFLIIVATGCSSGRSPVSPSGDLTARSNGTPPQTHLWGYYDIYIDIPSQTGVAILNRSVMLSTNVVQHVNNSYANFSLRINGLFVGTGFVDVDTDIGLKHPFAGLPEYNAYDVRGIFIGGGSKALLYNPDLKYAAHKSPVDQEMHDYALVTPDPGVNGNPDGYTRWFNPTEFLTPGRLGYTAGKHSSAGYTGTATLNPYKYFADGLGVSDDAFSFITSSTGHGVFSAGMKNTRNYYLRFPIGAGAPGIKFNYAIVANWNGRDEADHPANAPEACGISASVVPDLYYVSGTDKGGKLIVNFSFPNRWGATPSGIYIESSVLHNPYPLSISEMVPVGGGDGYSMYHVEVAADNIMSTANQEFWIIAQYDSYDYRNEFGVINLAGNDKLAAFFRFDLYIAPTPYGGKWDDKESTPLAGGYGEALAGAGSFVYVIRDLDAGSSPQFWRYNPTSDNWVSLSTSGLPAGAFRNGTTLTWDSADNLYGLGGARYTDPDRRLFYRYSISGDNWTQAADSPAPEGAGDAAVWSGFDNKLYAIIGSNQHGTAFADYDPGVDTWNSLTVCPAGTDDGASIAWTGGTSLVALRGEYYESVPLQDFWGYDIAKDSWTILTPIPKSEGVGDGGSLIWIGNWDAAKTNYVYALGGGNPDESPGSYFYRYSISNDAWEAMPAIPYPVGWYNGNRLGFASGYIFYWQGTPSTFPGGGKKFARFVF